MKIIHIIFSNEAPADIPKLIMSLQEHGVNQCVVMPTDAPRFRELQDAGIRMAQQIFAVPFIPLQRILTRLLIKREKPDIVHTWMRRGAALVGKPYPHNNPQIVGWFGGYYDPAKFKNCAHLVGVTKDIVAHMVKKGIPDSRAHFIPTFPDIAAEPPVDRATLATPPDAKVLLALSRLHPKKGLDTLLAALKELPDCIVWLAGDGPLRHELETLAKKLGVIDRVRFLGWRTDRAALLRAADVCVLPSRYEPFGTVILEAWATHTPLVACASAGPAAHVENEVTGLLSPIDDVPALTAALRRVLDDEPLQQRLASNGYAAYVKDYTRESVTRQWIDFYKTLCAEKSA